MGKAFGMPYTVSLAVRGLLHSSGNSCVGRVVEQYCMPGSQQVPEVVIGQQQ